MVKKNQGILLIEALLSIIILGTGITAVVRAYSFSLKCHQLTKDDLIALRLVEEKMSDLEAQPELEEKEGSGKFDAPDNSFNWKIKTTLLEKNEHEDDKENKQIKPETKYYKVQAEVYWISHGEHHMDIDTIVVKKKKLDDQATNNKPSIIDPNTLQTAE